MMFVKVICKRYDGISKFCIWWLKDGNRKSLPGGAIDSRGRETLSPCAKGWWFGHGSTPTTLPAWHRTVALYHLVPRVLFSHGCCSCLWLRERKWLWYGRECFLHRSSHQKAGRDSDRDGEWCRTILFQRRNGRKVHARALQRDHRIPTNAVKCGAGAKWLCGASSCYRWRQDRWRAFRRGWLACKGASLGSGPPH